VSSILIGRSILLDHLLGFRAFNRVTAQYPQKTGASVPLSSFLLVSLTWLVFLSLPALAQQDDSAKPVVVQPGAPGQPSKRLPSSTRATLPPRSPANVEFMQGMIMHHAQAVEMTALIPTHTENKELQALGSRISSSQTDEIKFMKRWLAARGEPVSMDLHGAMPDMDMSHHGMPLMPGMLTLEQMEALRKRAEIKIMQNMLEKKPLGEKR
jgi:uncharacterized protein (DUF305 family)